MSFGWRKNYVAALPVGADKGGFMGYRNGKQNDEKSQSLVYGSLAFLIFAVAYYLPLILDPDEKVIRDPRVQELFSGALHIKEVQIDLFVNAATHLVLLFVVYVMLSWVARRINANGHVSWLVMRLLTLVTGFLAIVSLNGVFFPLSQHAVFFNSLASEPWAALFSGVLALLVVLSLFSYKKMFQKIAVFAFFVVFACFIKYSDNIDLHAHPESRRNIILIGVDSLSANAFENYGHNFPNLYKLMADSERYVNAYTPLGRTFPAWVSTLSGNYPAEHGAFFNLRKTEKVDKSRLITFELHKLGYKNIFAIDERRFAHIDRSFGFDEVIGPKAGVLDFVMQRFNDSPLTNALLQFEFSHNLLPFSRINTASYTNYDSKGFTNRIERATNNAGRIFLATHFESAHFPFKSRHFTEPVTHENLMLSQHLTALTAVDRQIGELMRGLERNGHLKEALIIILSDHGEALGEEEKGLNISGNGFALSVYGHGANLLSDHANRIVLGKIEYREGKVVNKSGLKYGSVSLTDIKQTLSNYAKGEGARIRAASKCIFVETGVRFSAANDYRKLNSEMLAIQAASYYEIEATGRMNLREDKIKELLARKDVGVRCGNRITYYLSDLDKFESFETDEHSRWFKEIPVPMADVELVNKYRAKLSVNL